MGAFQPGHHQAFGSPHIRTGLPFAPLIAANDPLPAEIIAAANLICHASGDLLMRASTLCGAMHRPVGFDRLTHALDLMQQEAEALASASRRIGETIRALEARAGS